MTKAPRTIKHDVGAAAAVSRAASRASAALDGLVKLGGTTAGSLGGLASFDAQGGEIQKMIAGILSGDADIGRRLDIVGASPVGRHLLEAALGKGGDAPKGHSIETIITEAVIGPLPDRPRRAPAGGKRVAVSSPPPAPVVADRRPVVNPIRTTADIGAVVRAARQRLGISQQAFADLAGVGRRFVSELEGGKASLEFGKVLQCCATAGIDLTASSRGAQ